MSRLSRSVDVLLVGVVLLSMALLCYAAEPLPELNDEEYAEIVRIYKAQSFTGLLPDEEKELDQCLRTHGMTRIDVSDANMLVTTVVRPRCFTQDPYAKYFSPDAARRFEELRKAEGKNDVTGQPITKEIGYVRLRSFMKYSLVKDELLPQLITLAKDGIKKLIVNVGNNDGGGVITALRAAELFSPHIGAFMVDTVLREEKKSGYRYTTGLPGAYRPENIALVMNRNSFSATEVFIRILQHWGACVIGEPSYGKGSFQDLYPLADGGLFQTTVGRFYAEYAGGFFEGKKIDPDIYDVDTPEVVAFDYLTGKRPCKGTVHAHVPTQQ